VYSSDVPAESPARQSVLFASSELVVKALKNKLAVHTKQDKPMTATAAVGKLLHFCVAMEVVQEEVVIEEDCIGTNCNYVKRK